MKKSLIDTSVWISHFKKPDSNLIKLIMEDAVLTHPFILQELYLGRPKGKEFIFDLLSKLPALPIMSLPEIYKIIDRHRLIGQGIGLVDTHLLGAALSAEVEIYTHDQKLRKIASRVL